MQIYGVSQEPTPAFGHPSEEGGRFGRRYLVYDEGGFPPVGKLIVGREELHKVALMVVDDGHEMGQAAFFFEDVNLVLGSDGGQLVEGLVGRKRDVPKVVVLACRAVGKLALGPVFVQRPELQDVVQPAGLPVAEYDGAHADAVQLWPRADHLAVEQLGVQLGRVLRVIHAKRHVQ